VNETGVALLQTTCGAADGEIVMNGSSLIVIEPDTALVTVHPFEFETTT
jgi:hypothetical protein